MKIKTAGMLCIITLGLAGLARADLLFPSYLTPSFVGGSNTEFSHWDVFFAPNGGINYPDMAAPNGVRSNATTAGFTNPGPDVWSPANPIAFWHVANPSLRQVNGGHFIIGAAHTGNIYSFAAPGFYELDDTTPYTLGIVVMQFQTTGTTMQQGSIRLVYDPGSGPIELAPNHYVREYRGATSAFGGVDNRTAVQWDLTGLGVSAYQIRFNSSQSSLSLQNLLLDTSAAFAPVVPEGRVWIGTGSQVWSGGSNWVGGAPSQEFGNMFLQHAAPTSIHLDGPRTVGELEFRTAPNVTITGASMLRSNTGITTTGNASGLYEIQAPVEMTALNLMRIANGTVRLDGPVSGAYAIQKSGDGALVLGGNNTFGSATAGLTVQGGTLRIEGANTYGGATSVWNSIVEVATHAPVSAPGAFGNATSTVSLDDNARIIIDGNHTVARNINAVALSSSPVSLEKRLGAKNTGAGALYSGNIAALGTATTASNLKLFAQGVNDRVTFSGNLTGGTGNRTVIINGDGELGTVVFAGANKTYASGTNVSGGTLLVSAGTATTGAGAWTVQAGATLRVDGVVGGAGALTLDSGATLGGSGIVNKAVTIGNGTVLSPGNSPGALTTGNHIWGSGGSYLWQINDVSSGADAGWDLLQVNGQLAITAAFATPFTIDITSLTPGTIAGLAHNFQDIPHTSYDWVIASATGGISGFDATKFFLDTSGFANSFTGSFSINAVGNNVILTYTAIPEPSAFALLLMAASLAAWRGTRRRKLQPALSAQL